MCVSKNVFCCVILVLSINKFTCCVYAVVRTEVRSKKSCIALCTKYCAFCYFCHFCKLLYKSYYSIISPFKLLLLKLHYLVNASGHNYYCELLNYWITSLFQCSCIRLRINDWRKMDGIHLNRNSHPTQDIVLARNKFTNHLTVLVFAHEKL